MPLHLPNLNPQAEPEVKPAKRAQRIKREPTDSEILALKMAKFTNAEIESLNSDLIQIRKSLLIPGRLEIKKFPGAENTYWAIDRIQNKLALMKTYEIGNRPIKSKYFIQALTIPELKLSLSIAKDSLVREKLEYALTSDQNSKG